ncbi:hypothetical protein B5X24_HaOG213146 [Helicoverpa armigera]|nr:hypothetical protein B5X24_HaOG213146 [Helicoverpa armigera]
MVTSASCEPTVNIYSCQLREALFDLDAVADKCMLRTRLASSSAASKPSTVEQRLPPTTCLPPALLSRLCTTCNV